MTENTDINGNPNKMSTAILVVVLIIALSTLGAFMYLKAQDTNSTDNTNTSSEQTDTTSVSAKQEFELSPGNPVVAIVNGEKIYRDEVMNYIQGLPQEMVAGIEMPRLFYMGLNQMVNTTIIDNKIRESGFKSQEKIQKQLDRITDEFLREKFVEDKIESQVTDSQVKEIYEAEKAKSEGKTEINASHILVDSKEKAEDLIAKLNEGADFAELARENSQDPTKERGGNLGWFLQEGELVPEFANAAFSIEPGSYSKEPVKTGFGWHVIKVNDKRTREFPPFEDVKDAIAEQLKRQTLNEFMNKLITESEIQTFDINGNPVQAPSANMPKSQENPQE